jgi:hypothetical protein
MRELAAPSVRSSNGCRINGKERVRDVSSKIDDEPGTMECRMQAAGNVEKGRGELIPMGIGRVGMCNVARGIVVWGLSWGMCQPCEVWEL